MAYRCAGSALRWGYQLLALLGIAGYVLTVTMVSDRSICLQLKSILNKFSDAPETPVGLALATVASLLSTSTMER
ncbi:hypothetical protein EDD85DRAFT_477225 [Armillaria nabsnona]|nr:hypothetical protein EDD85DRAFT_477225 [Armillaria nabsnona]